jgi:hypothetical protein
MHHEELQVLMQHLQERKVMKKSLTPKQMKIANAANPKDKITGADFKALKKKKAKKKVI